MRVGAVDAHPTIVSGLRAELSRLDPQQRLVCAAPTVAGLLETSPELDVVLLELRLADGSQPRDNIQRIHDAGARVVIFTDRASDAVMREVMSAGAWGIVLKDQDVASVAAAVRVVNGGRRLAVSEELEASFRSRDLVRPKLSERERQVLELYAVGLPAKSVARRLGVQLGTAKVYLKRIRAKYAALGRGAGTRVELYQRAIEDGFIDPPGADSSFSA